MSADSPSSRAPHQRRRPNPLRELSEQAVLEAIFGHGPVTRPQIARHTELSTATVGAAVDRLQQAGLIRQTGPRHGLRGRSPLAYVVRDSAGFVVGVDIGGANIRAGVADTFGELLYDEQYATAGPGGRAVSTQVLEITSRMVERARATHERLCAVGISTPGVVDEASGRVTSLAYNVSIDGGLDPLAVLRARLDVPILVENNVNLAAVGEAWHGLANGVSTFAFVAIGAGVGMGLVIGGELVRGAHGAAGEIAYLPSSSDPFDPRHRLHGGLEDEIGAEAILATFSAQAGGGASTASSARDVFDLAGAGDPTASSVVDGVARRLSGAIASVIAVIDPELVVLGGGIGGNPALVAPLRTLVAELVPLSARIETSTLGDKAALYGSIAAALREARAQQLTRPGQ
jgi:predicted NBD/HSP70 family sugar kinase